MWAPPGVHHVEARTTQKARGMKCPVAGMADSSELFPVWREFRYAPKPDPPIYLSVPLNHRAINPEDAELDLQSE